MPFSAPTTTYNGYKLMSELVQSFGDSTEPMVVLDGVSKVFGNGPKAVVAVDNVSLSINRGEIFAIIGYSGAGKSTLVRLINGLETTTSGTLTVGGFQISGKRDSELREARTNIGMIFQQFNLMNSRTVLGNVEFPLKIAGWSKKDRRERALEMLEFVGLADRAGHYPNQLSGGMAAAVAGAFFDAGFSQGMIIARNEETGRALAERYEYAWAPEVGNLRAPILVNVTPIGMAGGEESEELSYPQEAIAEAQVVFDVVAMPVETPLVRAARAAGKEVIHGGEVIALQAAEQFRLYTGVELTPEEVEEAEAQAN